MTGATKLKNSLSAFIAMSITLSSFVGAKAFTTSGFNYSPITVQELQTQAHTVLDNAKAAGRLNAKQVDSFNNRLNNAMSLTDVEQTWADLEAAAQVAKADHVSLNNLTSQFLARISDLEHKGIITPTAGGNFYKDQIAGIQRLKKQLTAKDNFFDFWQFIILAIDLSSLQDRLARALAESNPQMETLDDLILRTDNYVLRNDVAARMLTTYKSFEVEPDNLLLTKNVLYSVLRDKAHSRITTPEVRDQLFDRLNKIQYEAAKILPTEAEIDRAIAEVQRLLDSGAANGHLGAYDDVRVRHELELVKEIKKAYPGPNSGIDPLAKELRMEEVRYMSLDLRFLQDWLGRILRKDGDAMQAREQILRAVRRIDLAYFSHRIRKEDAISLLADINAAIQNSNSDVALVEQCRAVEGKIDMMVSDYSMVPAQTYARMNNIATMIDFLQVEREECSVELQRISHLVDKVRAMPEGSAKYGESIVAAVELELLRDRVSTLRKVRHAAPARTS